MQSVKDRKNTKKYKNTNCIFGRNGKIPKKIQKCKVYFFVFYLYFFVFLLYFYKKKYEKIEKKYEKIRMQLLKNTKYKKKTNQQFQKYKIQKKIRTQNLQKYNIQRKDKFKNKPKSQPRVHCGNQETNCKKIQNQPLVFSKTCSSDFVFLICLFFVFFWYFFNIGRKTLL